MNLADHTADAGTIFNLNLLRDFVKTQGKERTLLIDGGSNLALNLLDSDFCHFPILLLLSVKHFIHADTTLSGNGIGVADFAQGEDGSLHQVVGVR